MLSRSVGPILYWWRVHGGNVREITEQNLTEVKPIPDIKRWLEPHDENIGENMAEKIETLHCTAYYGISGDDVNYANEVQNSLGMEFNIETADLWMGKKGIRLEVKFA